MKTWKGANAPLLTGTHIPFTLLTFTLQKRISEAYIFLSLCLHLERQLFSEMLAYSIVPRAPSCQIVCQNQAESFAWLWKNTMRLLSEIVWRDTRFNRMPEGFIFWELRKCELLLFVVICFFLSLCCVTDRGEREGWERESETVRRKDMDGGEGRERKPTWWRGVERTGRCYLSQSVYQLLLFQLHLMPVTSFLQGSVRGEQQRAVSSSFSFFSCSILFSLSQGGDMPVNGHTGDAVMLFLVSVTFRPPVLL